LAYSNDMVRRLPVIQNKAPEDAAAEARPAWHWILIGAGFVVTLWAPLAVVALWIGQRSTLAVTVTGVVLSYALATISAGAMVGRFGGSAGHREAMFAGLLAAALMWSLAAVGGSLSPWPVALGSFAVLAGLGVVFTRWGSALGARRRPRSTSGSRG
jgi:hypothetical protein